MSCFSNNLPCWKFSICAGISVGCVILSSTMLIISESNNALIPFWCSLLSSNCAYWLDAPKYNDKKKEPQITDL